MFKEGSLNYRKKLNVLFWRNHRHGQIKKPFEFGKKIHGLSCFFASMPSRSKWRRRALCHVSLQNDSLTANDYFL